MKRDLFVNRRTKWEQKDKRGKQRKSKKSKSREGACPSTLCCGRDAAVTREMLTGLYVGITIPSTGRQIAGDKASSDWSPEERDKKWARSRPPSATHRNKQTRAGEQSGNSSMPWWHFSKKKYKAWTPTFMPKKANTSQPEFSFSLGFIQGKTRGLRC